MDTSVDVLSLGRARRYDTAVALDSVQLLGRLFAGGYVPNKWHRLLQQPLSRLPRGPLQRMMLHNTREVADVRCSPQWAHLWLRLVVKSTDAFFAQRSCFSTNAGRQSKSPVIIAEQTEALEAFEIVKKRGGKSILMMTGQSPLSRRLSLSVEHLNWPPCGPITLSSVDESRLVERETVELHLADAILSPSSFVTDSLTLYPVLRNTPIFPIDWPIWGDELKLAKPRFGLSRGRIRILFVGAISLHKGVMHLTKALEQLPKASFDARFIGGINLPSTLLDRCRAVAELESFVPHSEMINHYRWADIFVLPSLTEGRSRAVLEAMAAGLSVIVTANTGAPVRHGFNGLVVPPSSSDAVLNAIEKLQADPELYSNLSASAISTVSEMTVPRYAQQLVDALSRIV